MSTTPSGNPIGLPVSPRSWPDTTSTPLKGTHITLTPRSASHLPSLYACLGGPSHAPLWDYIPSGPFLSPSTFNSYFLESQPSIPNSSFWTILDNGTGLAVGSVALLNIQPEHRTCEVGYVLFSTSLQRTVAATEVHFLLARAAFETFGCRRYEWKCDTLNAPSRRAALRLGFVPEGVFRQHYVVKGRNRDTAWFSIVDGEWKVVKRALEQWLRASNFDESGKQIQRLEECREDARHFYETLVPLMAGVGR